jgi:hypothetical protein
MSKLGLEKGSGLGGANKANQITSKWTKNQTWKERKKPWTKEAKKGTSRAPKKVRSQEAKNQTSRQAKKQRREKRNSKV